MKLNIYKALPGISCSLTKSQTVEAESTTYVRHFSESLCRALDRRRQAIKVYGLVAIVCENCEWKAGGKVRSTSQDSQFVTPGTSRWQLSLNTHPMDPGNKGGSSVGTGTTAKWLGSKENAERPTLKGLSDDANK